MKNKYQRNDGFFEVVVPFGNPQAGADALFDDCPICQELRRQIERGEVDAVPMQIDLNI